MNRQPICDYTNSDYQTSFWDQGEREYEDRVEAIALKRLLPPSGELLLEIGAGAGRNTQRYEGFKRIVLLDYSITQLQQAQQKLGTTDRYIYVVADAYHMPFVAGLFDAATMIRTIHHFANVPSVFQQIRRVLESNALFILEYPNKQNIKAVLRYLLHHQSWNPFSLEPIEFVELHYDFHPRQICRWLLNSDFNVERQLTVSHFRINLMKRFLPLTLLVSMDAIMQLTGDWWQLSPSVFVRSRSAGKSLTAEKGKFFSCPICGSYLADEHPDGYKCSNCLHDWPIINGIYCFRDI